MFVDTRIVTESKSVWLEGLAVIIIGFAIVANTSITDIVFHDNYVLPAVEVCYAENQDDFCKNLRERMNLPSDAQLEIGNIYWNELARQGIFIGFIMFVIRMTFAYILQKTHMKRIRGSTILMAIFWGLTGTGIFLFGFVDFFYYVIQDIDFPDELAWLNNAGLFTESKTWTGDPTLVEKEDLFLTNALGLLILGLFLFIVMYSFSESGLKDSIA